jgi:hypothetical protein
LVTPVVVGVKAQPLFATANALPFERNKVDLTGCVVIYKLSATPGAVGPVVFQHICKIILLDPSQVNAFGIKPKVIVPAPKVTGTLLAVAVALVLRTRVVLGGPETTVVFGGIPAPTKFIPTEILTALDTVIVDEPIVVFIV